MKQQVTLLRAMFVSALLGVTFALPRIALAHGEPVIAPNTGVIAAGNQIMITGSGMEAGEEFTITLEGVSGSTPLGNATATAEGEDAGFTASFTVPELVKPGTYTLKAVTDDGDGATADLTVNRAVKHSQRRAHRSSHGK